MENDLTAAAVVPLTRVNLKFLDLEIQALRKKIQLYKKTSIKDKEQIEYLNASHPDAKYEHLQTRANKKYQIYLKIKSTFEENNRIIEDINEDFKRFKAITHLKSCIECGEIIFEMRKLRTQRNIYIDFRKNRDRFKMNHKNLVRKVRLKLFNFMKNVQDTSSHIEELCELIGRNLKKKLSNEAFRICWQTSSGNTRRYIGAKVNNIGLQSHIFMTSQLRMPERRVKSKTSKESKSSKRSFHEILGKMREITNLRQRIDKVTKEIAHARKRNQERRSSELDSRSMPPNIFITDGQLKYPVLHFARHKFQHRYSYPGGETNRYNLMLSQIEQMNTVTEEIMNRAQMLKKFRGNTGNLIGKCMEINFQRKELHSFFQDVYDLTRQPFLEESNEELQPSSTWDFPFGSESSMVKVNFNFKSKPEIEENSIDIFSNLTMLTDQTLHSGSSVSSRRASILLDVESDSEELNYIYEVQKEDEEEELEENMLYTQISFGASMDS